jgi:general secretion pathway protein N
MNAAGQRRLTPILLLSLAVLAGVWLALLWGVGSRGHWPAASLPRSAPVSDRAAPLPPPLARDRFAVIWQQPLFDPDRRPAAPAADNASIGELELTGVIVTPTLHMALLHDRQDNRELRLHRGETLPGGSLTLVEVRPRSAVFDSASGRVELRLPAGAAIDASAAPHDAMPGIDDPPPPAASVPATSDTSAQRIRALRQIIQKRRAAQAAAVHEGEH